MQQCTINQKSHRELRGIKFTLYSSPRMIQHCGGNVLCSYVDADLTKNIPLNGWWGVWLVIIILTPCVVIVLVVVYCVCHSASHPPPFSDILSVNSPPNQAGTNRDEGESAPIVQSVEASNELDQPVDSQEKYRPSNVTSEGEGHKAASHHTIIPVSRVAVEDEDPDSPGMHVSDIENQNEVEIDPV